MDKKITIRLDDDLYDAIENNARILNKNKSETTRLMLEMFMDSKVYIEKNKNILFWHGSRRID